MSLAPLLDPNLTALRLAAERLRALAEMAGTEMTLEQIRAKAAEWAADCEAAVRRMGREG